MPWLRAHSYLEALDQHAPSRVGMFAGAITAGRTLRLTVRMSVSTCTDIALVMWFADHYHSQVHTDKDMFLTYFNCKCSQYVVNNSSGSAFRLRKAPYMKADKVPGGMLVNATVVTAVSMAMDSASLNYKLFN